MAESKNQLQQILDDILQDKNTNLTPDNLKQGVTCLGIKGNLQEGIDTSDATAIASDISNGKTAYVNKKKIIGTLIDNNGQITLDNQDDITAKTGSDYLDVHTNIGTDTIVRANNPISIRPSFEKTAEAIGLTADKIIEGNTILGIEGTGKTSEDLQEQLDNQDLIIQQLEQALENKTASGEDLPYSELFALASSIMETGIEDDSETADFNEDEEEICLYKALKILKGVI